MAKIILTGGSGFIGKALTSYLLSNGHEVAWYSRKKGLSNDLGVPQYFWNPDSNFMDVEGLKWASYVIHLAGESVGAGRWTKQRKSTIISSRVKGLNIIYKALSEEGVHIDCLVTASGINYYFESAKNFPHQVNEPPGNSFLAEVSVEWEAAAMQCLKYCRVVSVRTGIVLDSSGGAYPAMAKPAKKGLAISFGSGKQIVPWISLKDLLSMYEVALFSKEVSDPVNAVSQSVIDMNTFQDELAFSFGRKRWLPNVPSFFLRLLMGEQADLLLHGESCKPPSSPFHLEDCNLKELLSNLSKAFHE